MEHLPVQYIGYLPYGDFVEDPDDNDITEIKLIDPNEFNKKYFNWGEVGDHITKRAIDLRKGM